MLSKTPVSRELITLKNELLNKVKSILKHEFIGIDHLIDELTEAVGFWYLFPDLQDKPLVINLWGMTGVGKTSLIKRLVSLLEMEKSFFMFDLGSRTRYSLGIEAVLEEIYENENGKPLILAFDEFHNARTLNKEGTDNFNSPSRIVWQLLDSGKYQIHPNSSQLSALFRVKRDLELCLKMGVVVKNGLVTGKKEFFLKNFYDEDPFSVFSKMKRKGQAQEIPFVDSAMYSTIHDLAPDLFFSKNDVIEKLLSMDGFETVELLEKIYQNGISPKWVDCSKSLIFILGNLDEAYHLSGNFNPDIQPDYLHEQTLKVDVFKIKKALRCRFRSEHIGRLGNIHFLFPAFSKNSFEQLIEQELGKIAKIINSRFSVKLEFEKSVVKMIYDEGVFPTQGTRPVYSTIQQYIKSKLGKIMSQMMIRGLEIDAIKIGFSQEQLTVNYLKKKEIQHSLCLPLSLNLIKLKSSRKDDAQAITAVHESGHAVISIFLLNSIPELIISSTPEVGQNGFIQSSLQWDYVGKADIVKRLAMMLGGLVAEKLIFGEENFTSGSENDLQLATQFATEMIKSSGMGSKLGAFHSKSPQTFNYLYDRSDDLSTEAENLLLDAYRLAENTLKQHQLLLLKMSEFLSDERALTKGQCLKMVNECGYDFPPLEISREREPDFYRKLLKKRISSFSADGDNSLIDKPKAGGIELAMN